MGIIGEERPVRFAPALVSPLFPSLVSADADNGRMAQSRPGRMTAGPRREQLISVARSLFAREGYQTVSVEEIAAAAGVSKPIVYEHFGGKEGLYAVVVDREMQLLTRLLSDSMRDANDHPRHLTEKACLALLSYIDEHSEGFRILTRDSPITEPGSSFNSLLGDISTRVEYLLSATFRTHGIPVESAPFYAQMLIGMTVYTGQYWAAHHQVSKIELASDIVNLAWNGLSRMSPHPTLRFEGPDAARNRAEYERRKHALPSDDGQPERSGSQGAESHDAESTLSDSAPTSAVASPAPDNDPARRVERKIEKTRAKAAAKIQRLETKKQQKEEKAKGERAAAEQE